MSPAHNRRGNAGILGNIIKSVYIPTTAFLAYIFFDEVMTLLAAIGAIIIMFAILFVTAVKIFRENCGKKEEGEEDLAMEEKRPIITVESPSDAIQQRRNGGRAQCSFFPPRCYRLVISRCCDRNGTVSEQEDTTVSVKNDSCSLTP